MYLHLSNTMGDHFLDSSFFMPGLLLIPGLYASPFLN